MFQPQDRQETVLEQLYGLKAKFLSLQGQINATHPDAFVSQVLTTIGDVINAHIVATKMMAIVTVSADIFVPTLPLPGIDISFDERSGFESEGEDPDIPF